MDPRPPAPDQKTAALVDDFLAAQLAPRTRATYATDLALYLGWLQRRGTQPLAAGRREIDRYRNCTRHGHQAPPIPYTQQAVSRLLVELATAAGLLGADHGEVDRMHPHRLRHTFVTILLDRGQGLATVQDAARHASADTTRLYDKKRDAYRTHPTHELVF
jgi:site-specific recombinase XerD